MPDHAAVQTVQKAVDVLEHWAAAFEKRAAREIRRTELVEIQQQSLAKLVSLRFAAPHGSDFRQLMSNIALVASREDRDHMLESWLYAFSDFLQKQLRARDPFNWKGESKSFLYGLEMALPKGSWPRGFTDR